MDHREHTSFIEGCMICKISTISFGMGTRPTRSGNAEVVEAREKRWQKDMPAYKELRQQGLQPPRIDGAARLAAKAETRFEIESGTILEGKSKEITTALNAFEDMTGKSAMTPNTAPVKV